MPHFIKSNSKITFKDKKSGLFYRGVLHKKSKYTWSITYKTSKRSHKTFDIPQDDLYNLYQNGNLLFGHKHLITTNETPESTIEDKFSFPTPSLPIHDQPISSLNKDVSFTVNQLRRAFGFRNINQLLPHIKQCSQQNFSISTQDEEPFVDLGQTATIDKTKKNSTPLDLPNFFGHTIHVDILFGAGTAHGGAKYALYFVDRASRYKMIYPLKNLTTDILDKFQQHSKDLGFTPKRYISDCDKKLFSAEVKTWLEDNKSKINAAPEGKQRQNGLAERS